LHGELFTEAVVLKTTNYCVRIHKQLLALNYVLLFVSFVQTQQYHHSNTTVLCSFSGTE